MFIDNFVNSKPVIPPRTVTVSHQLTSSGMTVVRLAVIPVP
ncbi:hypothetical protein [Wolbachia endosymbiont (group A) of Anomoia purmunda]|nr:hypothetical protein [Wolbachia endosymbiont (group A) of Anomoia purmunda]